MDLGNFLRAKTSGAVRFSGRSGITNTRAPLRAAAQSAPADFAARRAGRVGSSSGTGGGSRITSGSSGSGSRISGSSGTGSRAGGTIGCSGSFTGGAAGSAASGASVEMFRCPDGGHFRWRNVSALPIASRLRWRSECRSRLFRNDARLSSRGLSTRRNSRARWLGVRESAYRRSFWRTRTRCSGSSAPGPARQPVLVTNGSASTRLREPASDGTLGAGLSDALMNSRVLWAPGTVSARCGNGVPHIPQ